MIGYLNSYANCATVVRQSCDSRATVGKTHPVHRHLTLSTLLPCWDSVKTVRFNNPE